MAVTRLPVACLLALTLVACGAGGQHRRRWARRPPDQLSARASHTASATRAASGSAAASTPPGATRRPRAYPVDRRVLRLVDRTRTIRLPDGELRPRPLTTIVRYPADRRDGPFPLIVFGHGFAVTPAIYARLLMRWASAGFVVAAPIFPLENADAPGGPDERDLVNQPQDMRVVIDRLLGAAARSGDWASGLIDRRAIAVAGQSDGGETALAVAYDRVYRDPRVRAAVLLSGARLPVGGSASLIAHGPPLLAVQGSADPINPPARTDAVFAAESAPKFLLTLFGAGHLAPYTTEQPQLTIVQRATVAFLRAYLTPGVRRGAQLAALMRAARRPGLASLLARP